MNCVNRCLLLNSLRPRGRCATSSAVGDALEYHLVPLPALTALTMGVYWWHLRMWLATNCLPSMCKIWAMSGMKLLIHPHTSTSWPKLASYSPGMQAGPFQAGPLWLRSLQWHLCQFAET